MLDNQFYSEEISESEEYAFKYLSIHYVKKKMSKSTI